MKASHLEKGSHFVYVDHLERPAIKTGEEALIIFRVISDPKEGGMIGIAAPNGRLGAIKPDEEVLACYV